MPIVNIHLLEGRGIAKKRELVKAVTKTIVDTLGADPKRVRIILSDMKHHDYSVAGVLHCDEPAKPSKTASGPANKKPRKK